MATPQPKALQVRVSVLICSRERPNALMRCLQSVLQQDYPYITQILILDDNSKTCDLAEIVGSTLKDSRIQWFRSNVSLGVAGGRNFLMERAEGDIFIIIDDDAYFADRLSVKNIVNCFTENQQIGILAFKVINHDSKGEDLLVPFSRRWRREMPHITEELQMVSYYVGTCHAIHRGVIEECGFYQDDFIYGGEELDLSYRVIQAGLCIMYVPSVLVHHYPSPSVVEKGSGFEHSYSTRNSIVLAYKYLPWVYIPVYIAVWVFYHGISAIKNGSFRVFLRGVCAGLAQMKRLERTPLSREARTYLKAHYGRLWY